MLRNVVRKKTGLCGKNSQFGKPLLSKKKVEFIFHFRTSGTFLVFIKKSPFWVIDWNYVVGIGEHMDVCVCLCLCLCLFFCLSFWGLDCWKMFQRGCAAITIATWLVFPSCTRASHTAKINEAKFQMTMDSFGQYQKVQKCDSDARFVQVIFHHSIAKRDHMANLMVLRFSMQWFTYNLIIDWLGCLTNGTHVILYGDTCPSVY